MHPFFYNSALKYLPVDNIEEGQVQIEHDVWIGANVIFTPGCSRGALAQWLAETRHEYCTIGLIRS